MKGEAAGVTPRSRPGMWPRGGWQGWARPLGKNWDTGGLLVLFFKEIWIIFSCVSSQFLNVGIYFKNLNVQAEKRLDKQYRGATRPWRPQ